MKEITIRRPLRASDIEGLDAVKRDIEAMKHTRSGSTLPGYFGRKSQESRTATIVSQSEAIKAKVEAIRSPLEAHLAIMDKRSEVESNLIKRDLENKKLAAEVRKTEAEAKINELVCEDRALSLLIKRREIEGEET